MKIIMDDLRTLFGDTIPIEVAAMLCQADETKSVDDLRREITAYARIVTGPRPDAAMVEAGAKALYSSDDPDDQWDYANAWDDLSDREREPYLTKARAVLGATPDDALANLVNRFSMVVIAKLRDAAAKYGYTDEWKNPDWADTLRLHIREHVDKGDPRDVAAYAAFAWYHGWSLSNS